MQGPATKTTYNNQFAGEYWTPVTGLLQWADSQPDSIYLVQPLDGEVTEYSWREVAEQVRAMAGHLANLDLPEGSSIALLAKNCAHFIMADLAILMAGHVTVPIYPTQNAKTLDYILEHSEARLLVLGPMDDISAVEAAVPADLMTVSLPGATPVASLTDQLTWDTIIEQAQPLAAPVARDPQAMARIVYTSGSTGQPKGVMVSMRALSISGEKLIASLKPLSTEDRMISYLPLAHVIEAAAVEMTSLFYGCRVYFSEGLSSFAQDLQRARPTVFHSVPRLWIKFQQAVLAKLPQAKLDELLASEETAEATRKQVLTQPGLQDAEVAITGSAPLAPVVQRWYRGLGLELLEGYAMSENFCYSHLSLPGRSRIVYVGHPAPGVQCRIADTGEVQIKSPGAMLGYYKAPEKTAESFTADGWFQTGDLGEIDEDGRLKITGRLKEIFKTSKGKYVAPVPIECQIGHPQVEVVCVTGSNQPQPCVLMMLSPAAAESLANDEGKASLSGAIASQLDEINEGLDQHERLAFAVLISDEWRIDNGMLTPTMKIRRDAIEKQYIDRLDEWYATGETVIWAD